MNIFEKFRQLTQSFSLIILAGLLCIVTTLRAGRLEGPNCLPGWGQEILRFSKASRQALGRAQPPLYFVLWVTFLALPSLQVVLYHEVARDYDIYPLLFFSLSIYYQLY
jgi:hypothetical protein